MSLDFYDIFLFTAMFYIMPNPWSVVQPPVIAFFLWKSTVCSHHGLHNVLVSSKAFWLKAKTVCISEHHCS